MRWLFAATFVVIATASAYVASPFWAAWTLREAIKAGDTATIERKVVWPSVRDSLRASIARHQQLLPEANELGEQVQPSVWQRVKSAFGASMLDRFMETYVTPEGLPKLFRYRKMWKENVKGEPDDEKLAFAERAGNFYRRITRAEFQSPTRVEIEIADRNRPDRRYVSVMELHGFEWKLTRLTIAAATQTPGTTAIPERATGTP